MSKPLIDTITTYSLGICPILAIPFEDGSKIIVRKKHLDAALESPVVCALRRPDGLEFVGGGARYFLRGIMPHWTVNREIRNWAKQRRGHNGNRRAHKAHKVKWWEVEAQAYNDFEGYEDAPE